MKIALLLGLLTPFIAWADLACFESTDRREKVLEVSIKTNRYGYKYQVLTFSRPVEIPGYGQTVVGFAYDNTAGDFPGLDTDNCTDGASLAVAVGKPSQLRFACHIDSVGADFVTALELYCE